MQAERENMEGLRRRQALRERLEADLDAEIAAEKAAWKAWATEAARAAEGEARAAGSTVQAEHVPAGYQNHKAVAGGDECCGSTVAAAYEINMQAAHEYMDGLSSQQLSEAAAWARANEEAARAAELHQLQQRLREAVLEAEIAAEDAAWVKSHEEAAGASELHQLQQRL